MYTILLQLKFANLLIISGLNNYTKSTTWPTCRDNIIGTDTVIDNTIIYNWIIVT